MPQLAPATHMRENQPGFFSLFLARPPLANYATVCRTVFLFDLSGRNVFFARHLAVARAASIATKRFRRASPIALIARGVFVHTVPLPFRPDKVVKQSQSTLRNHGRLRKKHTIGHKLLRLLSDGCRIAVTCFRSTCADWASSMDRAQASAKSGLKSRFPAAPKR